jgi:hypothetical protein
VLRLLLILFVALCSAAVLSVVDALSSADEPNSSPGATTAPTHSSVPRHAARATTANASFTVHDRGTGDMHRRDMPTIVSLSKLSSRLRQGLLFGVGWRLSLSFFLASASSSWH